MLLPLQLLSVLAVPSHMFAAIVSSCLLPQLLLVRCICDSHCCPPSTAVILAIATYLMELLSPPFHLWSPPLSAAHVGTLKDGYVRNVPLPRVPQRQSASHDMSHESIAPSRCIQAGTPLPDYLPVSSWIPTLPKLGRLLGFSQRLL